MAAESTRPCGWPGRGWAWGYGRACQLPGWEGLPRGRLTQLLHLQVRQVSPGQRGWQHLSHLWERQPPLPPQARSQPPAQQKGSPSPRPW